MSITAVPNARVYGLATAVGSANRAVWLPGTRGPAWTNGTARTFRFRWATICLGLHASFLPDGGE